jgi:hypothetical protein
MVLASGGRVHGVVVVGLRQATAVGEIVARLDRLRAGGPPPVLSPRQHIAPPEGEGGRFESVDLPRECPAP